MSRRVLVATVVISAIGAVASGVGSAVIFALEGPVVVGITFGVVSVLWMTIVGLWTSVTYTWGRIDGLGS